MTVNSDGSFTYTPNSGFTGSDSFTYNANDGTTNSNTATVTLTVSNDAPLANNDSYAVHKNVALTVNAAGGVLSNDTDTNGDALTPVNVSTPANGTVTVNANGSFSYSPNSGFTGTDSFTYQANDGTTNSSTATVTLTISNDAPVAANDNYTVHKNVALTVTAANGVLSNDSDANGDTLTALNASTPAHGTVTLNPNGSFTYTPNSGFTGTDSFTCQANDGTANSSAATVTLTVSNDAPVAVSDGPYAASKNIPLMVTAGSGLLANDTDANSDALTAIKVSNPFNGTVTVNPDGSFTYTPNTGFTGIDSFTYKTNDGTADSNVAIVSFTVTNTAPVAVNDAYSLNENTPLTTTVAAGLLANDTDANNDTLTAVKVSDPTHGTLSFNANGSFTYTPATNYIGADSFTYMASDGTASSNLATVNLTVVRTTLAVSTLTPTTSGFTATFDKAFVPTSLALYGANTNTVQAAILTQGGPLAAAAPTTITNQGSGYVQASTTVTFSAPAGVGTVQTGNALISTATESGTTVTITTTAAHGYRVGQTVTIAGITTSGYNGPFTITALVGTTQFKYTAASSLGASGSVVGATASQLGQTATGTVTVSSGKVTAITITNPGSGYTTAPTVTINGVGSNAAVTAAITTTNITGSLLLDAGNTTALFVKTGLNVVGTTNSLLASGNYLVTLASGTNAFQSSTAGLLDGNADGTSGDNYTTTFAVNNLGTFATVSVADFARGPEKAETTGNTTNISIPNNQAAGSGVGLPITIFTNSTTVTSVMVTLNYDPTLLTITNGSGNVNSTLAGSPSFTVSVPTAGTANITFSTSTALTANTIVRLGGLVAQVPSTAPYENKALLTLNSISVNGVATTFGAAGVEVVDYFGDVNGSSGTINGADTSLVQRVGTGLDTGFAAFGRVDPLIIGDFNVSGKIDGTDAGIETTVASSSTSAFVPAVTIPTGGLVIGGPDPTLSLPAVQANAAGVAVVPVLLNDPRPAGSTGLTEANLALTYDPTALSVSAADIQPGSIPSAGTSWTLTSTLDAATGQIGIQLYSMTPITSAEAGSLVTINFHVLPGATQSQTSVHLVGSVNPNGSGMVHTALDDSQGGFILTPAPMNVPGGVVGSIALGGTPAVSQTAAETPAAATPAAPEASQAAATTSDGDASQIEAAIISDESNRRDLLHSDVATGIIVTAPASSLATVNLSANVAVTPLEPVSILTNATAGAGSSNLPFGVSDLGYGVFASLGGDVVIGSSAAQHVEIPATQKTAHDLSGTIEESTELTLDTAMDALLSSRLETSRESRDGVEALIV